jgi:hypothetical protein
MDQTDLNGSTNGKKSFKKIKNFKELWWGRSSTNAYEAGSGGNSCSEPLLSRQQSEDTRMQPGIVLPIRMPQPTKTMGHACKVERKSFLNYVPNQAIIQE